MVTESFDFDRIVDRHHTDATKIEGMVEKFGRGDLLPFWIADMDFEAPPCILDALRSRLDQRVLGYTTVPEDFWQSIASWLGRRHGWNVDTGEITFLPGLKKGLSLCINFFSRPGDKVIIQPPVYHSFRSVIEGNGRRVAVNPLILGDDGSYSMDFDNLEKVADEKCRLLILSNPHNPAGITWDRETLCRLAEFCHRRGILVISDEIHSDMALWDNRHIPFASVSPEAASCSITFGAPSKTFNIAGIVSSYAIVPAPQIRDRFFGWLRANELNDPTLFAPIATIAAFSQGEEWRREMLRYVEGNIDLVTDYCRANIPQIKPLRPQASFLVWLDCRALGLDHDALVDLFVKKARLALNDGEMFGPEGRGFMRLNVASPRAVIREALDRLSTAVRETAKI